MAALQAACLLWTSWSATAAESVDVAGGCLAEVGELLGVCLAAIAELAGVPLLDFDGAGAGGVEAELQSSRAFGSFLGRDRSSQSGTGGRQPLALVI